jgi:hypothetical protein
VRFLELVEVRNDPRYWAVFAPDYLLALSLYYYTSLNDHYYVGAVRKE